jgi:predicted pore-forming effector associated with SMODS systems
MINLLPISRVIGSIAVTYAVLVVLVTIGVREFIDDSAWKSITLAFSGATLLQFVLLGLIYVGWRRIWRLVPALNRLFPDVNGEWVMRIQWQGLAQSGGDVNARAVLRQNFIHLSMEVHSPNSDSQTLIAQPKRDAESGRPHLYYVYLVTPISSSPNRGAPYYGAAILRFFEEDGGSFRGNYWTTQSTKGTFTLHRRTLT